MKEKRVMIHKEIHKFCDAMLKRVLEGLRKYNKDVKYGYANPGPSDADAEYLRIYEEDIEEQLKHHDQMRRCPNSTANSGSNPMMYHERIIRVSPQSKNDGGRARDERENEVIPLSKDCGGHESATNRHTRDGSG
nr:hypothetical protein [Tanacetum cinerariifolium]